MTWIYSSFSSSSREDSFFADVTRKVQMQVPAESDQAIQVILVCIEYFTHIFSNKTLRQIFDIWTLDIFRRILTEDSEHDIPFLYY